MMQTIEILPPEVTEILFRSGPRTPVIVEDEKRIRDLHHQNPGRLSEKEYFAPKSNESPTSLQAKLAPFICKQAQEDIPDSEADIPLDEIPDIFNLPLIPQRRVEIQIVKKEPLPFYFIDEEDVPAADDED